MKLKGITELEALKNAANSVELPGLEVHQMYSEDRRKTTGRYFLQLGNCTLSPVSDYEQLNYFIHGFAVAIKLKIKEQQTSKPN